MLTCTLSAAQPKMGTRETSCESEGGWCNDQCYSMSTAWFIKHVVTSICSTPRTRGNGLLPDLTFWCRPWRYLSGFVADALVGSKLTISTYQTFKIHCELCKFFNLLSGLSYATFLAAAAISEFPWRLLPSNLELAEPQESQPCQANRNSQFASAKTHVRIDISHQRRCSSR